MKKNPRRKILTVYFLCCFGMMSFAQQVTFSVKNVTVKAAVIQFKNVTGYSFVFGSNKINTQKVISVNANNQPLKDVVDQILAGQNLDYDINGKFIIVKGRLPSTQKPSGTIQKNNSSKSKSRVTGMVVDEKGEPIIGATIKVENSSLGTVTDVNGSYSLDVPVGSNLEISYVGYKRKKVGSGIDKKIVLEEEPKAINEVVVVGYGTQKKVDLTGAVASVSGKELAYKPVASIGQALEGVIPNLNVSATTGSPNAVSSFNVVHPTNA